MVGWGRAQAVGKAVGSLTERRHADEERTSPAGSSASRQHGDHSAAPSRPYDAAQLQRLIGIQGDTGGAVVDESSPLAPAAHAVWRKAVEELVLGGVSQGVRAVILRPAIVYGRGGGIPAGLAPLAGG